MRTTLDPKNEKIKLRLNEDMKHKICENASKEGISVSEYLRELINWAMINKK